MSDTDQDTDVFSLLAKIDLSIGKTNDRLTSMQKKQDEWRSLSESPRYVRIHGAATLNSSGFGIIKFDNSPDSGRMWYIRKLAISGVTPTTTVAGRGDLYVSTSDYRNYTSLAQCGVMEWCDQAVTLPLVGDFSKGELVVQFQEDLFVAISGGTASQQVICVGLAEDFQTASYQVEWNL